MTGASHGVTTAPSTPRRSASRSNPQRILAWAAQGRTLRQRDWMDRATPDGGPPIMRLAVVIGRLEKRGHKFDRRTFGTHSEVEYRLVVERGTVPTAATDAPTVAPIEQDRLFDARSAFWEQDL